MNDLINAIETCINNGEYYGALVISLMIPSVAAAASAANNRDNQTKYITWYDQYVDSMNGFSGGDCYKLRCKLLHQGISAPDDGPGFNSIYSNFIFTLPNPINNRAFDNHEINSSNNTHTIDIELTTFAEAIANAGKKWLREVKDDSRIQMNLSKTVQKRPYVTAGINMPAIEIIS